MQNPFQIYSPNSSTSGSNKRSKARRIDGDQLSWEESAHGHAEDPEDFYESNGTHTNITLFIAALALIFVGLGARLAVLQVAQGAHYRTLADSNHIREQEVLAPRGIVYDSQGAPLVQNVPSFELVATPMDLPKDQGALTAEITLLSQATGTDVQATVDAIHAADPTSFQAISINPNLTHDQSLVFQASADKFPGFSIENNPVREYQNSEVFSAIMGYTGKVSPADIAQRGSGYSMDDYVGKTGIEQSYEQWLRGQPGERQVEVDASGKIQDVLGEVQPQTGNSLYLNIDAGLQSFLYSEISSKNNGKKAAAVAINPQNGKVLALVSVPGYNNNLFSKKISQQDYQALASNPEQPLFNRAISGTYPPGSTIKPVIASAALQTGTIAPDKKIDDTGDLVVGNFHFHGWKAGGLGMMDMRTAIAMSSDIYFYTVGGGQVKLGIQGLGPENIAKYDQLFGMGQKLGIDIQGEAAGIVGSPEWRAQKNGQAWYLGDTYHESIGQGDMAVTPLQDAEWTAVIANGGTLYKPYIVDHAEDATGKVVMQNSPTVIRSGFIDPKNIEIVREGMRQTVTAGTAKSLNSLPITSAGKTGTAQFDDANPGSSHAWFTAFAPYENPQIVITVLIEAGGEGSSVSEPIVKDALKWWADNRYGKK